jgi:hypothetical protein
LLSAAARRTASTSPTDNGNKGRRRLKFDTTKPLTLRESMRIVQKREAEKFDHRQQVNPPLAFCTIAAYSNNLYLFAGAQR